MTAQGPVSKVGKAPGILSADFKKSATDKVRADTSLSEIDKSRIASELISMFRVFCSIRSIDLESNQTAMRSLKTAHRFEAITLNAVLVLGPEKGPDLVSKWIAAGTTRCGPTEDLHPIAHDTDSSRIVRNLESLLFVLGPLHRNDISDKMIQDTASTIRDDYQQANYTYDPTEPPPYELSDEYIQDSFLCGLMLDWFGMDAVRAMDDLRHGSPQDYLQALCDCDGDIGAAIALAEIMA